MGMRVEARDRETRYSDYIGLIILIVLDQRREAKVLLQYVLVFKRSEIKADKNNNPTSANSNIDAPKGKPYKNKKNLFLF